MAGVKGRSGGPRKNSGGKRPGAGRKPKAAARKPLPELSRAEEVAIGASLPKGASAPPDPKTAGDARIRDAKLFLEQVISGEVVATADQIRAAQALLPFQHKKLGESGKKETKDEAARKAMSGSGRFTPAPPPAAGRPH